MSTKLVSLYSTLVLPNLSSTQTQAIAEAAAVATAKAGAETRSPMGVNWLWLPPFSDKSGTSWCNLFHLTKRRGGMTDSRRNILLLVSRSNTFSPSDMFPGSTAQPNEPSVMESSASATSRVSLAMQRAGKAD